MGLLENALSVSRIFPFEAVVLSGDSFFVQAAL